VRTGRDKTKKAMSTPTTFTGTAFQKSDEYIRSLPLDRSISRMEEVFQYSSRYEIKLRTFYMTRSYNFDAELVELMKFREYEQWWKDPIYGGLGLTKTDLQDYSSRGIDLALDYGYMIIVQIYDTYTKKWELAGSGANFDAFYWFDQSYFDVKTLGNFALIWKFYQKLARHLYRKEGDIVFGKFTVGDSVFVAPRYRRFNIARAMRYMRSIMNQHMGYELTLAIVKGDQAESVHRSAGSLPAIEGRWAEYAKREGIKEFPKELKDFIGALHIGHLDVTLVMTQRYLRRLHQRMDKEKARKMAERLESKL